MGLMSNINENIYFISGSEIWNKIRSKNRTFDRHNEFGVVSKAAGARDQETH